MSEKNALKTKKPTMESNSEEDLTKRISDKRDKLAEIHASIAIMGMQELTMEQKAKGRELEDRLHYRTLVAEDKLLDEKIDLFSQLLKVLRK